MCRCAAVAVLAGLLWAPSPQARAAGKPAAWIELRTPHFLVISNGKEKQARRVGRQLEQVRAALERSFPGFRLATHGSLVVLALKDEASMHALVSPPRGRRRPELPAGLFLEAQERSCVLLRLDQDDDAFHPAYHEYVHALLALNVARLPLWLTEGLAEFYANAQFDAHNAYLGGEGWQTRYLRGRFLLPLPLLLAVAPASSIYRDPIRSQLFYAESWALIHFLSLGPGMANGGKLNLYLARLQAGDDQRQAFEEIFGSLADVQARFEFYLRSLALPSLHLRNLPPCDEQSFALRQLPPEEWVALAASLEIPERFSHPGLASVQP